MKKFIAVLMAAVMICSVAACGSQEAAGSSDAGSETTEDTDAEAEEESAEQAEPGAIEGSVWHATVNAGDYLTVKTGVTVDRKENDPMRYMDYDGLCVEYDFAFGEDGILTITPSEDQSAFQAALRDKVELALQEYYKGVMEQKGVTVSVEKYMEMEKVDIDHYVKVGTHIPDDLFGANTFLTSMFPGEANYVVDADSNTIYWSKTYSDARLFDAGVKWTYTQSGNEITITAQENKSGYAIDQWAGIGEASVITPDQATVFPMTMVRK